MLKFTANWEACCIILVRSRTVSGLRYKQPKVHILVVIVDLYIIKRHKTVRSVIND